jgi:hypothetical protein
LLWFQSCVKDKIFVSSLPSSLSSHSPVHKMSHVLCWTWLSSHTSLQSEYSLLRQLCPGKGPMWTPWISGGSPAEWYRDGLWLRMTPGRSGRSNPSGQDHQTSWRQ